MTTDNNQFVDVAREVAEIRTRKRIAHQFILDSLKRDGFVVITVPDAESRDDQSLARVLIDAFAQLGGLLPQSRAGNLVHAVEPAAGAPVRSFYSNSNVGGHIHTDGTFIHVPPPEYVGLICINPAIEGGDSLLISGSKVVDYLRRTQPEVLDFLTSHEFYFDTDQQIETTGVVRRKILMTEGGLDLQYFRRLIELGHERAGVPLTGQETEALDALDAALSTREHISTRRLIRGQMLIIDNKTTLHSREPFPLSTTAGERDRLLLRVWARREAPTP